VRKTAWALLAVVLTFFAMTAEAARKINRHEVGQNWPQLQSYEMGPTTSTQHPSVTLHLIIPTDVVALGDPVTDLESWWDTDDDPSDHNFEIRKITRWKFWHDFGSKQEMTVAIFNEGRVTGPTTMFAQGFITYDWKIEADSIAIVWSGNSGTNLSSLLW